MFLFASDFHAYLDFIVQIALDIHRVSGVLASAVGGIYVRIQDQIIKTAL